MKQFDLSQTVSILANIGVIAGMFFLVFEIRQNNENLEIQSRRTFNDRAVATAQFLIEHPDLLELSLRDEATFTPVESTQMALFRSSILLQWEEQFEDIRDGRLDGSGLVVAWRAIFWGPANWGLPAHWGEYKPRASAEFVQFIDENVVAPGPP